MSHPYQPGDTIRLTWALDDPDTRQPAAGATVALAVAPPNGPVELVPVTETAPGRWAGSIVVEQVGAYSYRWTATGAVGASDSGTLYVEPHVPAVQ